MLGGGGLAANVPNMYFVGIGIFFFVAILCVVAYVVTMRRRRDYERGD